MFLALKGPATFVHQSIEFVGVILEKTVGFGHM